MKATLFSANQKAQKTIEMEKLVGLIRDGFGKRGEPVAGRLLLFYRKKAGWDVCQKPI